MIRVGTLRRSRCSKAVTWATKQNMKTASKLSMTLLPKFPGLKFEDVFIDAECVSLAVASARPGATCPVCGCESGRLHSHYRRTVADLPWGGRSVKLSLKVRRFRCPEPSCPRRIFAESLTSLVEPCARRTTRLREVLLLLGFALGGEAGSRLAVRLGMRAGPSTLLRSLHGAALPFFEPPEVIGVDDFAPLEGRKYGTIVVDFEKRRPIELLEGRSAEILAAWLGKYPKIRIIGRDRSTEYERGIEKGAPRAVEVLDRWHLLKNLRQSTEHVLESNSARLSKITPPVKGDSGEEDTLAEHAPVPRSSKERAASAAYRNKMLARYWKVKKLHAQGMRMLAICRATGMSRGAVRRYVHADSFPERRRHPPQESMLDPFTPYLVKRWEEGCHVAMQLWRGTKGRGYPGSPGRVLQWARRRGREPAPSTPGRYVDSMRKKTSKNSKRLSGKPPPPIVLPAPGVDDGARSRGTLLRRAACSGACDGGLPGRGRHLPARLEILRNGPLSEGRRVRGVAAGVPLARRCGLRDLRDWSQAGGSGRGGSALAAVQQRSNRGPGEPIETDKEIDVRQSQLRVAQAAVPRRGVSTSLSDSPSVVFKPHRKRRRATKPT